MEFLNYHHLRYFRVIAGELNLTRAARKLNLSPPALSVQLKQLEESLGHVLFDRRHGGLELTEAGSMALDYADAIGRAGEELMDVMSHRMGARRQVLRVGAVATLSRNFLLAFVSPILNRAEIELVLRSGSLSELLLAMQAHEVDLVLTNDAVHRDAQRPWHSHRLADQSVALVGAPEWKQKKLRFPRDFGDVPLVLPGHANNARAGFDRLLASAGVRPLIMAEVDDMAMLRLVARAHRGLAILPPIVVKDELENGVLVEVAQLPGLQETFYALTVPRRYAHPMLQSLLQEG
jgi:LysR family transcriptional activator of nhaA